MFYLYFIEILKYHDRATESKSVGVIRGSVSVLGSEVILTCSQGLVLQPLWKESSAVCGFLL